MNKTTTLIKLCAMTLLCALALTIFYPLIFLACAAIEAAGLRTVHRRIQALDIAEDDKADACGYCTNAARRLPLWRNAWDHLIAPFAVPGAHSGLANPAGVSFRCAVGNGLGSPGSNTGGIRAHIDELVIVKGWAGDISGITSEIVL